MSEAELHVIEARPRGGILNKVRRGEYRCARGREADRLTLDDAIRDRLVTMTTDFKALWHDRRLPNRDRKRLLAHIIEDVTLVKLPDVGTTRIHVRFKGGKTETLTTKNPKSSAQQVKSKRSFSYV